MGFAQIVVELQPKVNVFVVVLIRRANAKRVVLVPAICPAKLEEVMQIKKIDNSCLIQGDCIEAMQMLIEQGVKVDAVITDPPYGTTACEWDSPVSFSRLWDAIGFITELKTPVLLFGQEPFSSFARLSNLKEYRYDIYWQKERLTNIFQVKKRPGKTVETISVFFKRQGTYNPQMTAYNGPLRSNKIKDGKLGALIDGQGKKPKEYNDTGKRYPIDVVQFGRDILKTNLHPTQKPVALMEYLVKTYTNEGDLVLDFTMGSGTTGVACRNLNRKFIGIELDENYYQIACDRIQNETGKEDK